MCKWQRNIHWWWLFTYLEEKVQQVPLYVANAEKLFNKNGCQKYSPLLLCPYILQPSCSKALPAERFLVSRFDFESNSFSDTCRVDIGTLSTVAVFWGRSVRTFEMRIETCVEKIMGGEGDESERTHVSLEPPQEKWFHDPLGVCYPVFLVVGPLALVLSTDSLLIVTYGRVSCS